MKTVLLYFYWKNKRRDVITALRLCCSTHLTLCLVQPRLEYCVSSCSLQYNKDIKLLESVQRKEKRMVKGLEKPYEE